MKRTVWFAAMALGLTTAPSVEAFTNTWDGGDRLSSIWSAPANWGFRVPSAGDDLGFPAGAARLNNFNDLAAGTAYRSIRLTGASYRITGNAIQLDAGLVASYSSGSSSVGLPITLRSNLTFTLGDFATSLTLDGALNLGGHTATFDVGGLLFPLRTVGTVEVLGDISGTGDIIKNGLGTLRLAGNNGYRGDTTVNFGQLVVDGVLSNSIVTVNSNGTLSGTGSMELLVSSGGTIKPGSDVPGRLLAPNGIQLDADTDLYIRANGAGLNGNYDSLQSYNVAFMNGCRLQFTLGYPAQRGDTFYIVRRGPNYNYGVTPFANLPEGAYLTNNQRVLGISYASPYISLTTVLDPDGPVRVWSGGGANGFWSTPANWLGGLVPTNGNALAFPAGTPRTTNTNDLATGTTFGPISVEDQYHFYGNAITLGGDLVGGLEISAIVEMDLILPAVRKIATRSSVVRLRGACSGPGGLDLSIGFVGGIHGAVYLEGGRPNSYTGPTTVAGGRAEFDKIPGPAVSGPLVINSGIVLLDAAGQFGSNAAVTVSVPGALRTSVDADVASLDGSGTVILEAVTLTIHGNATTSIFSGNLTAPATASLTKTGTGYGLLNVTGTIDLGGSTLNVVPDFPVPAGASFVLVDNDGADEVIGTFANLPEGEILQVNGSYFRVTYRGGTGNDVVLLAYGTTYPAITRVWDGGGADANWTTPENWVGDERPFRHDALLFPAGAQRLANSNDFPTNIVFQSLNFAGNGYLITGSNIVLTSDVTNSGNNAVGSALLFQAGATIHGATPGDALVLAGGLDAGGGDVTFAGPGDTTVSGPIRGAGHLTKTGSGVAMLLVSNSYLGDTRVLEGTLEMAHGSGLGNPTATVFVSDGAALTLANNISVPQSLSLAGAFNVAAGTNTWSGSISLPSTNAAVAVAANSALIVHGLISGNGGFRKTLPGNLILSTNNTYTGDTLIEGGSLFINGTQPDSVVRLRNGALLGGVGRTGGILSDQGIVSPGTNGPGLLRADGGIAFGPATTLRLQLNGTNAGVNYDVLRVVGTVELGGSTLDLSLGFTPGIGDMFLVLNNDGSDAVIGTFAGLPPGAIVTQNGVALRISYTGGDGNDVTLTRVSAPATLEGVTRLGNGQIQFQGEGEAALNYTILANTNLSTSNWVPIGTTPASGAGVFNFIDTNGPFFPRRFYRAMSP